MRPTYPTDAPSSKPNWPLLGALRFFLAAVVFNQHICLVQGNAAFASYFAPSAVCAFFVISGFSMSHSLSRGAAGFYERRFYRIWPLYMLGLILALVPLLRGGGFYQLPNGELAELPLREQFIGNALMLCPGLVKGLTTNPAAWTLGVEVAFYLVVPFYAQLQKHVRFCLLGTSAFFAVLAGSDAIFPQHGHDWWVYPGLWFLFALGFELFHYRETPPARLAAFALPMVAGVGTLTLGLSLVLVVTQSHIKIAPRWQRVLLYLGELSYPLYILHDPMMVIVNQAAPKAPEPTYYLAGLLAAIVAYHALDAPIRAWSRGRQKCSVSGSLARTPPRVVGAEADAAIVPLSSSQKKRSQSGKQGPVGLDVLSVNSLHNTPILPKCRKRKHER